MGRKSGLFARAILSPNPRFADIEAEIGESRRPCTRVFPLCENYRRGLVWSALPPACEQKLKLIGGRPVRCEDKGPETVYGTWHPSHRSCRSYPGVTSRTAGSVPSTKLWPLGFAKRLLVRQGHAEKFDFEEGHRLRNEASSFSSFRLG